MQTYSDKCRLFTGINNFWVLNKTLIDAINGLNKRRKETSISSFDFSAFYIKLPRKELLMVLNNLISVLMEEKVNILHVLVMGLVG